MCSQEARGREQPPLPVGHHDERVVAMQCLRPFCTLGRPVVRRLGLLQVRDVMAGPLAVFGVPPDEGLALAPGAALWVGRGAVVQHPPIQRPGPAPLPAVRPLLQPGLAAPGLVHLVGVYPAVDPAAARGAAVRAQVQVPVDRSPGAQVDPADVPQHVRAGRLVPFRGVVPGQVQQRAVPLVGRAGQLLLQPPPEVIEEPQLGPLIPGRLHRLVPSLQQSLIR